jgi:uncharacterized iron-regulated membrane protein
VEDHSEHGGGPAPVSAAPGDGAIDLVVAASRQLAFAAPVMVKPPKRPGGDWTVRSDAANRPLRASATIDPASGAVVTRENYADRHIIDRAVGYGVAAHEGRLFGLANQLLTTCVALGLFTLSASGVVLWWRRRPPGRLGAPRRDPGDKLPRPIVAGALLLAVVLPMFGASALLLYLGERLARLRRRMA